VDASAGKKSGIYDLAAALCMIGARGHSVDLKPWEEPAQAPVPKKMKIMLSGANPKPCREQLPKVESKVPAVPVPEKKKQVTAAQQKPINVSTTKTNLAAAKRGNIMTTPSNAYPHIDILQKGLEAIQQLQAQTARAHEKFLETQSMAGQSLAMMLEQTRTVQTGTPAQAYQAPITAVPTQVPPIPEPAPQPVEAAPAAVSSQTPPPVSTPAQVQVEAQIKPEPQTEVKTVLLKL